MTTKKILNAISVVFIISSLSGCGGSDTSSTIPNSIHSSAEYLTPTHPDLKLSSSYTGNKQLATLNVNNITNLLKEINNINNLEIIQVIQSPLGSSQKQTSIDENIITIDNKSLTRNLTTSQCSPTGSIEKDTYSSVTNDTTKIFSKYTYISCIHQKNTSTTLSGSLDFQEENQSFRIPNYTSIKNIYYSDFVAKSSNTLVYKGDHKTANYSGSKTTVINQLKSNTTTNKQTYFKELDISINKINGQICFTNEGCYNLEPDSSSTTIGYIRKRNSDELLRYFFGPLKITGANSKYAIVTFPSIDNNLSDTDFNNAFSKAAVKVTIINTDLSIDSNFDIPTQNIQ